MSGLEILRRYPYGRAVQSQDALTGKPTLVTIGAYRGDWGGSWVFYSAQNKPKLRFVRENMLLILSNFLDPWGRKFPTKGEKVKTIQTNEGEADEYYFPTTVAGEPVDCYVFVDPAWMLRLAPLDYKDWSFYET